MINFFLSGPRTINITESILDTDTEIDRVM
jgi:hypothetical protein